MSVSKELKRLIKRYVKVYGYNKGREMAYREWHRKKRQRRERRLGIWKNWKY